MHWSAKTMLESFYMSNMSPQEPSFNRGVWSKLEKAVRRFAYSEGSVVVVTVDDVEETTGLDFFSALPKDIQERLESKSNPKDWKWK